MSKSLADLLDEILPEDDEAIPTLAVKLARERLAATLGLPTAADVAVSTGDLAAYASGSFTPSEMLRFEQKLTSSPDAATDVASALQLLADLKADAAGKPARPLGVEDFMPLSLADDLDKLAASSAPVWEQEIRRTVGALLQTARQTSDRVIEVLSGLLPTQSDAWNFPPTPAFAVRATSRRTVSIEGVGKTDGSSISITADRSPGSVRLEVVVRDFPGDQLPPTLMIFSEASDVEAPLARLDPTRDAAGRQGTCRLFYEPDPLPPGGHVILMLGQDGAITFAAQIAAMSKP